MTMINVIETRVMLLTVKCNRDKGHVIDRGDVGMLWIGKGSIGMLGRFVV